MGSRFFIILFLMMVKIVYHPSLANEGSNQEKIAESERSSKIKRDEKLQNLEKKTYLQMIAPLPWPREEDDPNDAPRQPKTVASSEKDGSHE